MSYFRHKKFALEINNKISSVKFSSCELLLMYRSADQTIDCDIKQHAGAKINLPKNSHYFAIF